MPNAVAWGCKLCWGRRWPASSAAIVGGVYNRVAAACRQICWAHLKRDFQKIIDRGISSTDVGHKGLRIVKRVFAVWHAYRNEQVTREEMQKKMEVLANQLNKVLVEGEILDDDSSAAQFCA